MEEKGKSSPGYASLDYAFAFRLIQGFCAGSIICSIIYKHLREPTVIIPMVAIFIIAGLARRYYQ